MQKPSRPPRSRCCGCPGQPASTARRAPRGPGTPEGVTDPSAPLGMNQPSPCPPTNTKLTSVDVTVRTLSRSSTSCLKVGRCEGTACQHSRMIMYLWGTTGKGRSSPVVKLAPKPCTPERKATGEGSSTAQPQPPCHKAAGTKPSAEGMVADP